MIKSSIKFSVKDIINEKKKFLIAKFLLREMKNNIRLGYPRLIGFSFDSVSSAVNIDGIYERPYLELAIKWLKENNLVNGSVIDIGANIGNHSVFFSNFFEKVFAFEPNPLTFKVLHMNAEIHATNIRVYQLGVSDINGFLPFHTPNKSNISSSRIVKNEGQVNLSEVIQIPIIKLDTFNDIKDEKIGLIKIDVEGFELNVLSGAKNLIEKEKPVIFFEQHKEDFVNEQSPSIEFLRGLGYKFLIIGYSPKRSGNLNTVNRMFNFAVSLFKGSVMSISEPDKIEPDSHPFIIAYNNTIIS